MDPSIFKAYDVRGTYPEQMDEELAYRIGRAFPRVLSQLQDVPVDQLRVAVGRDMRLSAPAMAERYAGSRTRAPMCSTSGWSAPRCSTGRSDRASSTAG
jgi:phosphomannomutase